MSHKPEENEPYWKVLRREPLYQSDWINLYQDWVQLPDGTIIEGHHVLDYPKKAVGVVPVNAAGQVMLVDHYRFITDTRGWEIPAGGVDDQSPHTEDEIYVVKTGRATLVTDSGTAAVAPGSVIYVPAGETHRFTDVTEDLALIVIFAPPYNSRA